MASPRGDDDGGAMAAPLGESRAQVGVVAAATSTTEALVPPGDTWVVGGSGEKEKKEKVTVGGDGGGCLGGEGVVDGGNGGGSGVGGVGGDGSDGGDALVCRSEVLVEEIQVKERVVKGTPVVERVAEEIPVEETPVVTMGNAKPKGKGIATEKPIIAQGPVISPLYYTKSVMQKDVMARTWENPAVLDVVLTAVREARKAEMARVQAAEGGGEGCRGLGSRV